MKKAAPGRYGHHERKRNARANPSSGPQRLEALTMTRGSLLLNERGGILASSAGAFRIAWRLRLASRRLALRLRAATPIASPRTPPGFAPATYTVAALRGILTRLPHCTFAYRVVK